MSNIPFIKCLFFASLILHSFSELHYSQKLCSVVKDVMGVYGSILLFYHVVNATLKCNVNMYQIRQKKTVVVPTPLCSISV